MSQPVHHFFFSSDLRLLPLLTCLTVMVASVDYLSSQQNTNGGNDSFKMTSTEDDVGSPLQGSYNCETYSAQSLYLDIVFPPFLLCFLDSLFAAPSVPSSRRSSPRTVYLHHIMQWNDGH